MKKTPKKNTPNDWTPPNPDGTADVEVSEIQALSDYFTKEVLIDRACVAKAFQSCELNELVELIRQYSLSTAGFVGEALTMAGLAMLDAWTCGTALNEAKKKCKHGEFESWFQMEFLRSRSGDPPFSLRTAQRYMKLAEKNQSLEKLIKSSPSLRQAYQACGILPVPPEPEKPIIADREAVARIRLLKSVTSVQVKLRHFSDKKISLDDGTRKELLNAKTEIDRLFASLMG